MTGAKKVTGQGAVKVVEKTVTAIAEDATGTAIAIGLLKKAAVLAGTWLVEETVEHLKKSFEDNRADLVKDLVEMPLVDTANLRKWRAESEVDFGEAHFMTMLAKLPCPQGSDRKTLLKNLNNMSKTEFDQFFSMLEHDTLKQWAKCLQRDVIAAYTATTTSAGDTFTTFIAGVQQGAAHVNNAATSAAPTFGRFADRLENRGGRR